uniref:Uncharacterized protein n=1 Tax=Romanomermis culicivorax TaxID=13658 RepID=A0A915HVU3_ROMCU
MHGVHREIFDDSIARRRNFDFSTYNILILQRSGGHKSVKLDSAGSQKNFRYDWRLNGRARTPTLKSRRRRTEMF